MTRSPSDIARELLPGVHYAGSAIEAVRECDATVLVTEWPEIVALDCDLVAREMRGNVLVDGRNALDAGPVKAAGLVYEGIGRR